MRTTHRLAAAVTAVMLFIVGCSSSGAKKLTADDLSKAMPTAQEIGNGFTRDTAGEKDDSSELVIPGKCKTLLNNDEDKKSKVRAKREFKDDKNRQVNVGASTTERDLASIEKTVKSCTRVPFTDGEAKGVISFELTKSEDIGDAADVLDLELAFTQPITLSVKGHGVLAKRGDIGMTVLGVDGVDSDGNITPIDNEAIDKAARNLDQKIKSAQG